MTSELRDAEEVATEICGCAYANQRKRDIAVIEADREAVRQQTVEQIVAWLNSAARWLNGGECCGQKCSDGVCAAPACIWGDELKLLHSVANAIEAGEWKQ